MTAAAVALPGYGPLPTRVLIERPPCALSDNDCQTAATVARMRGHVCETANHPVVDQAAGAIVRGLLPTATRREKATAIWTWIKSELIFWNDEPELERLGMKAALELLIPPPRLLTMPIPAGDCDDYTMLACALLLRFGIPCQIVTIKADQEDPSRWSHVYAYAVLEDSSTMAMDVSHGRWPGWEAPRFFERKGWGFIYPRDLAKKGLNGYRFQGLGQEQPFWAPWVTAAVTGVKERFLAPPPGTFTQITPQGTIYSRAVPGAIPYPPGPGFGVGLGIPRGISGATVLAAGLGLGVLALVLSRRG